MKKSEKYFNAFFIKNLIYAFSAQTIALLLSVVMSLVVPKILGTGEFAYWQLYLFYISYVGFFHFGLNDGIYLKLGGKNYNELDFSLLHGQGIALLVSQIGIALMLVIGAKWFVTDPAREFVLIATGIYTILYNLAGYFGFVFQAVNETRTYSLSMIVDKLSFLVIVFALMIVDTQSFEPYIFLHILCKSVSTVYIVNKGRKILFAKSSPIGTVLSEIKDNICVGIKLTIANIASLLVLGSGRIVIDTVWGIETFGKLSFSLSLANFFLQFVSQISMVLFPALRKVDDQQQKRLYSKTRDILCIMLPVILLAYYPLKVIIGLWLPDYYDSLKYLALLLPICTFDAKMQMLCNTYFKVLRQEKVLLKNNLMAMALSVLLSCFGGFILRSLNFIVISMVLSIAFRSIISEVQLSKTIGSGKIMKRILPECILIAVFMSAFWFFKDYIAFFIYAVSYGAFLLMNRNSVKILLKSVVVKNRKRVKTDESE